jgi:hypothetical protein
MHNLSPWDETTCTHLHEACSCTCTCSCIILLSLMQYTSVLSANDMKRHTGALFKSMVYIIIICLQACRVQCVRGEVALTVVLISWLSPAWLNAPKLIPERWSDRRTMMYVGFPNWSMPSRLSLSSWPGRIISCHGEETQYLHKYLEPHLHVAFGIRIKLTCLRVNALIHL